MGLMNHRWVQIYLLPAAAFQSVIIGAGYGTGREVMEYISRHGPLGGIGSMIVIALCFSIVLSLSFEFARKVQAYEYRSFFKALLGRFWFLYEILFITAITVTLAVIGSAAGIVLHDSMGIPPLVGVVATLLVVVLANMAGRAFVNKLLTLWALVFLAVLAVYVIVVLSVRSGEIASAFVEHAGFVDSSWFMSGLQFSMFNLAVAPALLYTVRAQKSRKEAIGSGFFAGCFGVLPALAFHFTFMGSYPDVIEQELPVYWVIKSLGYPVLLALYGLALCGTIIQTGVGMLQGVNERINAWSLEKYGKGLSKVKRAGVAIIAISCSFLLAQIGIVTLVAKGYSTLSAGFMLVFILPLVTLGVSKIIRAD